MESKYLRDLERRREELRTRILDLRLELTRINSAISERKFEAAAAGSDKTPTRKNRRQLRFIGLIRQELLLESNAAGLRTREIYDRLTEDYGELKYTSLRSYLHRMKTDGQIYQGSRKGPWQLTELKEPSGR